VRRCTLRITDGNTSYDARCPAFENTMRHVSVRRSSPGTSEHIPLESTSGSIGIAASGKYTEVARARASMSSGEPSVT